MGVDGDEDGGEEKVMYQVLATVGGWVGFVSTGMNFGHCGVRVLPVFCCCAVELCASQPGLDAEFLCLSAYYCTPTTASAVPLQQLLLHIPPLPLLLCLYYGCCSAADLPSVIVRHHRYLA